MRLSEKQYNWLKLSHFGHTHPFWFHDTGRKDSGKYKLQYGTFMNHIIQLQAGRDFPEMVVNALSFCSEEPERVQAKV